jgi:hypothetical protein
MTTNTGKYSNLLQRPDKPALGRGRVQWGVKHALRHASEPITTGEAMKRAYSRRKRLGKPLADATMPTPVGRWTRSRFELGVDRVVAGRGYGGLRRSPPATMIDNAGLLATSTNCLQGDPRIR